MSFVAISRCESANSMRYMVDIYGAKVIIALLLDIFLFLSYSVIYSYVSFLMRLIEIIYKNIDFVVYSASSLCVAIKETSGELQTATLAATSSSSCIMNCTEAVDR